MSNIEHMIENAIEEIKQGKSFEDFTKQPLNAVMLRGVIAPASEIWEMAQYVVSRYERRTT